MKKTSLENWIFQKIGRSDNTRKFLEAYQLDKLNQTIEYVRRNSIFYKKHFSDVLPLQNLNDICKIPFTTSEHIKKNPLQFLCVSQDEIDRVVTLKTSGTTDAPKRIYFTADDLKLTIDFFANAMKDFVNPGQKVLILMPGEQPDSIGDLLKRALIQIDVEGVIFGPVIDFSKAIETVLELKIDALVGIPTQVLQLARTKKIPKNQIKSVILSADYVPDAITKAVESAWNCRVFNHYGMTEMGYGGGVECFVQNGYHFREADLFFEIVDPETGQIMPDGEYGEIVFTTLTRTGMPLIRYKTGDMARFLPEPCACGTLLKRMSPVRGRISGAVKLNNGHFLTVRDLDEALFSIPELLNYQAEINRKNDADFLNIFIYADGKNPQILENIKQAAAQIPAIQACLNNVNMHIGKINFSQENWFTSGMKKRIISDKRI